IVETAWALGYDAVRIHARTVQQRYTGASRWDFLKKARALWPGKTILGSGDVFDAHDAVRMLRETGVDIVWIARGAIGNPWIFEHAATLLAAAPVGARLVSPAAGDTSVAPTTRVAIQPPSIHEQRDALEEHFAIAMQIH